MTETTEEQVDARERARQEGATRGRRQHQLHRQKAAQHQQQVAEAQCLRVQVDLSQARHVAHQPAMGGVGQRVVRVVRRRLDRASDERSLERKEEESVKRGELERARGEEGSRRAVSAPEGALEEGVVERATKPGDVSRLLPRQRRSSTRHPAPLTGRRSPVVA